MHNSTRITKILIVNLEGVIQKNSYERRDYESVDEKSLSLATSKKKKKKKSKKRIHSLKGKVQNNEVLLFIGFFGPFVTAWCMKGRRSA